MRAVDPAFTEILDRIPVPLWHVGTEATHILPDLISLGVMGEKFDPAATKSVILLLFYSLMWPP